MKTLFLTLLTVTLLSLNALAQFDDKFYYPVKAWKPVDNLAFEEFYLDSDTVKLNGIFMKPVGKPKATVLFFHGAGGNVSTYLFMTRPLVEHGYQVFMIDFRAYGKSTGKPTHVNVAKDGQLVLNYVLARNDVKDTRLILFGASLGSQIATKLARDNQKQVSALVLDGPMASFTDIALKYAPKEQHDMIRQYLVSPYAAREDIKALDNMPKLVVYTKEDKEVPFDESELVFANAQGPKTSWIFTGGHLEGMKVDPATYLKKIDALIAR